MPFVSTPYLARVSVAKHNSLVDSHTLFGYHPETQDKLFIPHADRYAGTYILGVQGSGKSGLLQNLINSDIQAGHAVIVIDPHGDLTQACLGLIPDNRLPHTYLLDMEDEMFPFGCNIFSTGRLTNSLATTQAVERLMHIFEVLWPEVLSQQNLPRYVRGAALTLLANPGTTLLDMYSFLQDQSYRARLLSNVADPTVRQFWHTQYDNLGPHEQYRRVQPLLGRLEALFMGRSLVRNIVGQRQNTTSFRNVMTNKQIVFIKLPSKTIAQDARLIGTILLAQISAAVFSFANTPEAQRPGVSLYVDEFQHFATSDFSELLTEGRKFGMRVTVAHQYRNQLPSFLQASTMTARTKVCFQSTPEDAREMAHFYPSNEATVQAEDITEHPVNYLLTHPSNDPIMYEFVSTYLHPLQGHKRGAGRVEIDHFRYDWVNDKPMDKPRVTDPTWQLDNLLYEVMRTGNPSLTIPPEIVDGFSNCGVGFYKAARSIVYNDPVLTIETVFPRQLVGQRADGEPYWTRHPESGREQLYHFIFHLRFAMQVLAENPIGKATAASPTEVAKMLTNLPRRAAFVRSADTVGVIYTHNAIPPLPRDMLYTRISGILNQTRQIYCRPKAEVERWFMPVTAQAQAPVQPVQSIEIE
jgi:Type IV secretion-system coupling protein DNA-binding domain